MRPDDTRALLLILLAVLLVNAPAVTGWLDPDPMLVLSGLAHAGRDGLLPGGPGWTDPNTGTTTQALGHLSALEWLRGAIPWWNPYSGVGLPLAAIMQPSSLFLPFVLLLAFQKGVLALKIAMQILAGAATYGLLRRLDLSCLAALAGGLIYAMNGTFGWHGAYAPALPPAFLPLILLGVENAAAAARDRRPGGVALLAAGLAWSLYAGFPETAYAGGLLAGAWSLLLVAGPAAAGRRLAVLLRIAAGGLLGLLLAAPILLPFAEYMNGATLGPRHGGFGLFAYPPRFTALAFFPHIFGLPSGLWTYDTENVTPNLFALNGGWLGLSVPFLAALAALTPGRHRALRWLLAGWIVVNFAKTMAVPGLTGLVNLIPGIALIPWFRYGPPGWEMAGTVLAALAVDDWRRGTAPPAWRAVLAGALVLATAAATLAAGLPVFRSLLRTTPYYAAYLGASVGGALVLLAVLALVWRQPPRGRWRAAMLVAATLEPALLFFTPMLAGRRDIALDLGSVAFLQRHLGLQRFVSWGAIQANYGAYWHIAGLNYEYIPLPPDWLDHVLSTLDPQAAIFAWRGQVPAGPDGKPLGPSGLRALVPAYEADGVKYVVVRPGLPGFGTPDQSSAAAPRRAFLLPPDSWLSGSLAGMKGRNLRGAAVLVGTYGGASTGRLELELCAGMECAAGGAELAGAADDAALLAPLDRPLAVPDDTALRWRISHRGGTTGVAIWLYPDPPGAAPGLASPWGVQAGRPAFSFDDASAGGPRLVHTGPAAQIWELPNPVPYFTVTGGPCRLDAGSRLALGAVCEAPALLTRRELFYPGWTARVNGAVTEIARTDGLFQAIGLPQGASAVRFAYAPPFIAVAYALFALAFAVVAIGPLRRGLGLSRQAAPAVGAAVARVMRHGFLPLWLLGTALLILRSPDPLLHPALYAEDGVWASYLLSTGTDALFVARDDYFVAGNMLVIWLALQVTQLLAGADLTLLPAVLAVLADMVFASVAALAWLALAPVLSRPARLTGWLLLVLLPLGDTSNEILGRACNLGFAFAVLCVLLLCWRESWSERPGWRKLAIDLLVTLCMATNPVCSLVVAVYLAMRAWRRRRLAPDDAVLAGLLALISAATLLLPHPWFLLESPHPAAPQQPSGLIEVLLGRSLLYPLLFPFYRHLTDLRAVLLSVAWAGLLVMAWRTGRRPGMLPALALVALAAFGGGIVTQRTELTRFVDHYRTTSPDRYYYGQNLLAVLLTVWALDGLRRAARLRLVATCGLAALVLLYAVRLPRLFELRDPLMPIRTGPDFAGQVSAAARDRAALFDPRRRTLRVPIYPDQWMMDVPLANVRAMMHGEPMRPNLEAIPPSEGLP
jgi:hypothetical protein